jgi:hypothetical protein
MIVRADGLGGVLYYAESADGGRTWPDFARKTGIPNPGSKATLYPLGDDAVALLPNPNPRHRGHAHSPMLVAITNLTDEPWRTALPVVTQIAYHCAGVMQDDRRQPVGARLCD